MAIIIDGAPEEIPGLVTRSWGDDPKLHLTNEDCRPRITTWVRNIVLHTTKGIPGGTDPRPQVIIPGIGPNTDADGRLARLWSKDGRGAGAHLAVDHDGLVSCLADLKVDAAYHAGPCNDVSIGIEIYQGGGAEMYVGQLEVVVKLVDWLTRRFQIQRQIPDRYEGKPIQRLENGAKDFVGVFGHRHCSGNRGAGDPGDAIFSFLRDAGYERFDVGAGADRIVWKARQIDHKVSNPDGIPGPRTAVALARDGRPSGMWVARPGDDGARAAVA